MDLVIVEGFLKTEILQQTVEYGLHQLWWWNFPHTALSHFFKPQPEEISTQLLFEEKLSLTSAIVFAPLLPHRISFDYWAN